MSLITDEEEEGRNDHIAEFSTELLHYDMAIPATTQFFEQLYDSSSDEFSSSERDIVSIPTTSQLNLSLNIKNKLCSYVWPPLCHRRFYETSASIKAEKRYGISYKELLYPRQKTKVTGKAKAARIPSTLKIPLEAVHPSETLKTKLNKTFHTANPWMHKSLTISKLRNLKCDLFNLIDKLPDLEPSTVAIAWTYFERLVLRRAINKSNRKQYAGACLMLAFKFNEALKRDRLESLCQVIRTLDKKDNLSAHDVFTVEFKVFSLNEFELQVSFDDIASHLLEYFEVKERLFKDEYGHTLQEFLAQQIHEREAL